MLEDAQFYISQKAIIVNDRGEILILNDPYLGFDLPGGKVQIGETDFEKALKREVKEESGLEIKVTRPVHVWYFQFLKSEHRNSEKELCVILYEAVVKSGTVTLSDEHDSFKWVPKDKLLEVPMKEDFKEALTKYLHMDD